MAVTLAGLGLVGLIIGCGPGRPDAGSDVPLESLGWVAEVAREPGRFTQTVDEGRDGWVALHVHDYLGATAAFTNQPIGRMRAQLALAALYEDAARLAGYGTEQLYAAWDVRGGLPEGPEAPLVAALAASCAGTDPTPWAARVTAGPNVAVARTLADGGSPFGAGGDTPLAQRLTAHAEVRAGHRSPESLVRSAETPLLVKQEGEFRREFWDPCVAATLAARARTEVNQAVEAAGGLSAIRDGELGVRLFGGWPTAADVQHSLADESVSESTRLAALGTSSALIDGVGPFPAASDDVDAAKAWVRRLDGVLDHWSAELATSADPDGRVLLSELELVPRLRQEVVVVQAREALRGDRPRQALAILEQVRNPTKGPGDGNAPALYALLAEASLRLGRTREAMDAVQPLTEVYPFLHGTRETLGDWAVLKGLDRRGDSKENP